MLTVSNYFCSPRTASPQEAQGATGKVKGIFWSLSKVVLKEVDSLCCWATFFLAKEAAKITLRVILFLLRRLVKKLEQVI